MPIQEPWATKILKHGKKIEFRKWKPNLEQGKEIWIVATGNAPKPRMIIGKMVYNVYFDHKLNSKFSSDEISNWGGNEETNGLIFKNPVKFSPHLPMNAFVEQTPRKYQKIIISNPKK